MSGDRRGAGVEKEMRRRCETRRFEDRNAVDVPGNRRAQMGAVRQRRAAEELDRGTDRAVDIAGEPLPRSAAGCLRVRECQRLVAAPPCRENLAVEMAEAEDELNQNRKQRRELRRAAEPRPPDSETPKHRRQHRPKLAALTIAPYSAKPRAEPRRCR